MTAEKDYRLYLDEKFGRVNDRIDGMITTMNAHFETVDEKLSSIEKQTTRTNGRVTDLEVEVKTMDEEFAKEVAWGHHVVDTRASECPNIEDIKVLRRDIGSLKAEKSKDISDIKEGLLEYNFIKKYPTSIVIIGIVSILLFAAVIVNAINTTKGLFKTKTVIERVEKLEKELIK